MNEIHEILFKYWGYSEFRPMQEDIIQSVIGNNDTLALLPTGGGKSLCFQVPAMALEGICIVISPLIALMKDQVQNLKKKGIKAYALTSGMQPSEIDRILDNCVFDKAIKFLYVSPERLKTEIFIERFKRMKVSMIAVDEAHCISQWGYDFRPSYLEIANLREYHPKVSIIALTATATPDVAKDICSRLEFKDEKIFQQSFSRANLAYLVLYVEDKLSRLVKICRKVNKSGIVYVGTRKSTKEISDYLRGNKISALPYHAGLGHEMREKTQEQWINNNCRIIVATNAFGMGIDKPDVGFVVHLDLPASPEAYFQEAGRAGRDGEKAYATILNTKKDVPELIDKIKLQFPNVNFVKAVYQALANYFQLASGSGMGISMPIDLGDLAKRYKMHPLEMLYALKILELNEYIFLSDAFYTPSRVQFIMKHEDLYSFEVSHPKLEGMIQLLLRAYSGIFDNPIKINEYDLAKKIKKPVEVIFNGLNDLHKNKVIEYYPQNELPVITFTRERVDVNRIELKHETYRDRKKTAMYKAEAMHKYVKNDIICRSRQLLDYFGEKKDEACGICDVCILKRKKYLSDEEYERIKIDIKNLLRGKSVTIQDLTNKIVGRQGDVLHVLRWLSDNREVIYNAEENSVTLSQV